MKKLFQVPLVVLLVEWSSEMYPSEKEIVTPYTVEYDQFPNLNEVLGQYLESID